MLPLLPLGSSRHEVQPLGHMQPQCTYTRTRTHQLNRSPRLPNTNLLQPGDSAYQANLMSPRQGSCQGPAGRTYGGVPPAYLKAAAS